MAFWIFSCYLLPLGVLDLNKLPPAVNIMMLLITIVTMVIMDITWLGLLLGFGVEKVYCYL